MPLCLTISEGKPQAELHHSTVYGWLSERRVCFGLYLGWAQVCMLLQNMGRTLGYFGSLDVNVTLGMS